MARNPDGSSQSFSNIGIINISISIRKNAPVIRRQNRAKAYQFLVTKKTLKRHHCCGKIKNTVTDLQATPSPPKVRLFLRLGVGGFYLLSTSTHTFFLHSLGPCMLWGEAVLTRTPQGCFTPSPSSPSSSPSSSTCLPLECSALK